MNFTVSFSLIIIIGYFLSSCSGGGQKDEDTYVHVDFVGAERQSLYAEDVFDYVEFIPLETSYSCLLTEEPLILAVTDSFVVLSNMMRDAFLFDRKDGRFVQQVGKRGMVLMSIIFWFLMLVLINVIIYFIQIKEINGSE